MGYACTLFMTALYIFIHVSDCLCLWSLDAYTCLQVTYSLGAFIRHAMATYTLSPALDSVLARRQRLRSLLAHAAVDYDNGIDWVSGYGYDMGTCDSANDIETKCGGSGLCCNSHAYQAYVRCEQGLGLTRTCGLYVKGGTGFIG